MNRAAPMTAPARREDVLVSVCFADVRNVPEQIAAVKRLAEKVDARFRFWEFVVVANADDAAELLPLVNAVANLRLFTVRVGTEHYRKRVVAASEAIGDVVVITSCRELPYLDLVAMVEDAVAKGQIQIGQGTRSSRTERLIGPPLATLGRGAGFNVGLRGLQTMAIPRTLLNRILTHPDRDLALRFPPRDGGIGPGTVIARDGGPTPRSWRDLGRRITLLQKLLTNLAPRLLFYVSVASALVAVLGLFYLLYAIGSWIVVSELEPGWLTISLMLSFTACFLGCALFGLSLALQYLLALLERDRFDDVVDEVNRVDLFGQVARDLNVEVEVEVGRGKA